MVVTLALVGSAEDVRASIERFNDAAGSRSYARQLVRSTTYWIFDGTEETFGPSKFVGFSGLDAAGYDAALAGDFDGARFDGAVARGAVEAALGNAFVEHAELPQRLREWAEATFDEDVFDGVDDSKWKFVTVAEAPGRAERAAIGHRVWALFANPDLYRIDDVLRERHEDTWVTAGKDMHRGDQAIIWRGLGRDGKRGIVALAEIISDPYEADDSKNPFWVGPG